MFNLLIRIFLHETWVGDKQALTKRTIPFFNYLLLLVNKLSCFFTTQKFLEKEFNQHQKKIFYPPKKTKRGRKAMESCELTTFIFWSRRNKSRRNKQQSHQERQRKRRHDHHQPSVPRQKKNHQQFQNHRMKTSIFAPFVCRFLPKELNPKNSIKCNSFGRPDH